METTLTEKQARVLGAMIEKQWTTPQYYPMTTNAIKVACNQKNNRDPAVDYSDDEVFDTVRGLEDLNFVEIDGLESSRATRYRQSFSKALGLEKGETVILCELFNRGPQTVGELRTRCDRMFPLKDLAEVERCLTLLAQKGYAMMLEKAPGTKEPRWAHLFCGAPPVVIQTTSSHRASPAGNPDLPARVTQLEAQVQALEARLSALEKRVQ